VVATFAYISFIALEPLICRLCDDTYHIGWYRWSCTSVTHQAVADNGWSAGSNDLPPDGPGVLPRWDSEQLLSIRL